jgi:uncharacterized membrane protein
MNQDRRTRAQRYSDRAAEFCGSWHFIFIFSGAIVVWIILNTLLIVFGRFDEYPFILLNLALTIISTMQSPLIMMSQNRQTDRDREMVFHLHDKLDRLMEGQESIAVRTEMTE